MKAEVDDQLVKAIQKSVDDVLTVVLTVVEALKKQPGFDHDSFETAIRQRLEKHDLSRSGFSALSQMLKDPWGG